MKYVKYSAIILTFFILLCIVIFRFYPQWYEGIHNLFIAPEIGVSQDIDQSVEEAKKLVGEKNYEQAVFVLEPYVRLGASNPEVYRVIYAAYSLKGDNENALLALEKYVATEPAIAKYWLDYIDLKKASGAPVQEIYDLYRAAIVDVSKNTRKLELVDLYGSYASYLIATGLYDEAIAQLRLAQTIDVGRADYYDQQVQFAVQEKLKVR